MEAGRGEQPFRNFLAGHRAIFLRLIAHAQEIKEFILRRHEVRAVDVHQHLALFHDLAGREDFQALHVAIDACDIVPMALLIHGHGADGTDDGTERLARDRRVGHADELLAVQRDGEFAWLIRHHGRSGCRFGRHSVYTAGGRLAGVIAVLFHHGHEIHRADRALGLWIV